MTVKAKLKTALVAGIFFLSLGGVALHYFVHPPAKAPYGYVPFYVGIFSSAVIPWLFCFRKTIHLGYLLNGFTVIIGTITMGHFSLAVKPIWPDLFILWPKFAMGYALFHLELFNLESQTPKGAKFTRYPHFGFWLVHLAMLSAVYTLGNLLWR